MTPIELAVNSFSEWYNRVVPYGGYAAKGTIAGALVVLDKLKQRFDLNIDAHTAKGGSQVKGASGAAVMKILAQHGETRPFVGEGGRTNRGLRGDIRSMLDAIRQAHLDELSSEQRNQALDELQRILVEKVRDYHNRQRLKIVYEPSMTTRQIIQQLIKTAREAGKGGGVAQYLVGAKLQLRFPNMIIGNESYSTADVQLNRHGDFLVGNTIFHVTLAPMAALYDKCKRNLQDGFRVYVLVPDDAVYGVRQNAEMSAAGQIAVESIESFVGQNIEELASFSEDGLASGFRSLLELYNQRVAAIESDKSMMVEMPPNLK